MAEVYCVTGKLEEIRPDIQTTPDYIEAGRQPL